MKDRPKYFLSAENIDQEGEQFDYIRELHDYLWRFVRVANPGAGGSLKFYIDAAIKKLEERRRVKRWQKAIDYFCLYFMAWFLIVVSPLWLPIRLAWEIGKLKGEK